MVFLLRSNAFPVMKIWTTFLLVYAVGEQAATAIITDLEVQVAGKIRGQPGQTLVTVMAIVNTPSLPASSSIKFTPQIVDHRPFVRQPLDSRLTSLTWSGCNTLT